uniref:Protein LST4 n=1 Tax=Echinostoma caproni TaxID=27848 RepID=A0A183BDF4_9TREM
LTYRHIPVARTEPIFSNKIHFTFSFICKQLFTNQSVTANGTLPDGFKHLTVLTNWRASPSGLALRQPISGTAGVPLNEICTVLYSGSDSPDRLASQLIDLFPNAVYDFLKYYNADHPGSVLILVDLGPHLDGIVATGNSSAGPSPISPPENYNQALATMRPDPDVQIPFPTDESICRLCQIRLMLDRFLFCVEVTVCLPTQNEVNILKLQRELFALTNASAPTVASSSINNGEIETERTTTASGMGRIVNVPIPARFRGRDDMGVPSSSGLNGHSRSETSKPNLRRRSNSFSSLTNLDPARDSAMPPPYGQPTDQMTNSKHSSNEYFIVQPGDGSENQQLDGRSGSANRCPGCPAAFHRHAHR